MRGRRLFPARRLRASAGSNSAISAGHDGRVTSATKSPFEHIDEFHARASNVLLKEAQQRPCIIVAEPVGGPPGFGVERLLDNEAHAARIGNNDVRQPSE
jgi:hypothetical protein